jgi:Phage integrase SAM-like domain
MGKQRIKPNYRRRVLRLPDLDHCKTTVLNSLGSPASRRVYEYAINQFVAWYCSEPRLAFNRIVVVRYRMYLESRRLAANTINQQLAAVRRLAHEAADAGLLSPELAAGISRVKGVKQLGFRSGNWLTADAKFRSAQTCSWRYHARQARLRNAGHAVRLWFPQIRTCGPGVG